MNATAKQHRQKRPREFEAIKNPFDFQPHKPKHQPQTDTHQRNMVWQQYKAALAKYPLAVKATTAATLMSCSDVLGQTYEQANYRKILEKHEGVQYNWQRTAQVGITGFTFSGPISHGWYNLLEGMVGRMALTTAYSSVAAKMFLDAILFSPIAVAGYFVWRSALEGSDTRWKLENKWSSAVQASWGFWPLANIVNFSLVPLQFRVLYNNGLSIVWNAYLSNVNQGRLEQVVDLRAQQDAGELVENVSPPKVDPCVCSHCRPVRG